MSTSASAALGALHEIDHLLRGRQRLGSRRWSLVRHAGTVIVFGGVYGAALGSYGAVDGEHYLQVLYSAIKVPWLLIVTSLIALPSYCVVATLVGLRQDLPEALLAMGAAQVGVAVTLAALAPLTIVWYLSVPDYDVAILQGAVMFAIAAGAGQLLMRRYFRPMLRRNPRHRAMLWCWLGIYALVGIQMGWVLRPFIGSPTADVEFFRQSSWGNAYVEVFQIALEAMR